MIMERMIAAILLVSSSLAVAYDYGVDVSFPIHHDFSADGADVSETLKTWGGERIQVYNDYINGCRQRYGPSNKAHMCTHNEMDESKSQPAEADDELYRYRI